MSNGEEGNNFALFRTTKRVAGAPIATMSLNFGQEEERLDN